MNSVHAYLDHFLALTTEIAVSADSPYEAVAVAMCSFQWAALGAAIANYLLTFDTEPVLHGECVWCHALRLHDDQGILHKTDCPWTMRNLLYAKGEPG